MSARLGSDPERSGGVGEALSALVELEQVVSSAKAVPLTDQVRINEDRVYEPLDRLRHPLPQAITETRGCDGPRSRPISRPSARDTPASLRACSASKAPTGRKVRNPRQAASVSSAIPRAGQALATSNRPLDLLAE